MKTLHQNLWLVIVVAALIFSSCKKDIDANKQTTAETTNGQAIFLKCNNCLVSHTEEDIFGSVVDFFYNKKGNPDSLNFDGTPVTLEYDKWGRLIKQTYGTYAWHEFKYKGGNFLPYAHYYYYPEFEGLLAIDSFQYNIKGELISRISTNILHPEYNCIENYHYNVRGNVIRVDIAAHNGGTVYNPGYTEFIATKYDNKPNFITGSMWANFMMFNTEYDGDPYLWMLFSRNNAANYKWIYDNAGDSYSVTSSFQYNNAGFVNIVNMDFYDNVAGEDLGIFTRTSSSACDNTLLNPMQTSSPRSAFFKEKIITNKYGLPLPVK